MYFSVSTSVSVPGQFGSGPDSSPDIEGVLHLLSSILEVYPSLNKFHIDWQRDIIKNEFLTP